MSLGLFCTLFVWVSEFNLALPIILCSNFPSLNPLVVFFMMQTFSIDYSQASVECLGSNRFFLLSLCSRARVQL